MISRSLQKHIVIAGLVNSGKSTLFNSILGSDASIVSSEKGTTTDAVRKSMEVHGLGPVVFIDTAGFDDDTPLADERLKRTKEEFKKADAFIYLLSDEAEDKIILDEIKTYNKPIIYVVMAMGREGVKACDGSILYHGHSSREEIFTRLKKVLSQDEESLLDGLVKEGSTVLMVMPQDASAPKGRLIKAQVETLREALDRKLVSIVVTDDNLKMLRDRFTDIDLVICDSRVFKKVYDVFHDACKVTSFSVLFSKMKGDIKYFVESAKIFDRFKGDEHILIAEACTHPPLNEDIGTVKIPMMLKKRFGDGLKFTFVRANDFEDIDSYDMIIHCGACMFTRTYVSSRVSEAKEKGVAMTNYGITIAYLQGILDKISY